MSVYIVRADQNIYDIATLLYGTIEGVFDLLMSNSWLSIDDDLIAGTELEYHESYVLNESVKNAITSLGISMANSQQSTYPVDRGTGVKPLVLFSLTSNPRTFAVTLTFAATGTCKYSIDWGDGSDITVLTDAELSTTVTHDFDSGVSKAHVWLEGPASNVTSVSASGAIGEYYYLTTINGTVTNGTIS